jgi:hypothetical protein
MSPLASNIRPVVRVVVALLVMTMVPIWPVAAQPRTQPAIAGDSHIFEFTGAEQRFPVPAGVTSVTIEAIGASGSTSYPTWGGIGEGGISTATIAVTPGETLFIYVDGQGGESYEGEPGAGGFNGGGAGGVGTVVSAGGGGGGASDVRRGGNGLANRVVVAGGGGGEGCTSIVFDTMVSGGPGGRGRVYHLSTPAHQMIHERPAQSSRTLSFPVI